MKLLFLDTETTGNELLKDHLCQVSFKNEEGIYAEYFKPPLPISIKSMSITHITNKMVEDKPVFKGSKMHTQLQKLLSDHILVAHNCEFDCQMLAKEELQINQTICTYKVARYLDPDGLIPEYNLQYLRYALDLEIEAIAHDATGDVLVLEGIFNRLLAKMIEQLGDREKAIAAMVDISSKPILFKKLNFGKHKGETLEKIANTDASYLQWLLGEKQRVGDDPDWIFTLKHYLHVK